MLAIATQSTRPWSTSLIWWKSAPKWPIHSWCTPFVSFSNFSFPTIFARLSFLSFYRFFFRLPNPIMRYIPPLRNLQRVVEFADIFLYLKGKGSLLGSQLCAYYYVITTAGLKSNCPTASSLDGSYISYTIQIWHPLLRNVVYWFVRPIYGKQTHWWKSRQNKNPSPKRRCRSLLPLIGFYGGTMGFGATRNGGPDVI